MSTNVIQLRKFLEPADTIQVRPPASHAACMVCSPGGLLGVSFRPDGENSIIASVSARPEWQGYTGILHGGMVSTLLDAAMTHCLFHLQVEALTASLNLRFLEPTPCTGLLDLRATLAYRRRHVYLLEAELKTHGRVLARAEARFITSADTRCLPRGTHRE